MTTDLHGNAGRTITAGEAALCKKMQALSNALLRQDNPHVANAGHLVSDVLTGEFDPQLEELRAALRESR